MLSEGDEEAPHDAREEESAKKQPLVGEKGQEGQEGEEEEEEGAYAHGVQGGEIAVGQQQEDEGDNTKSSGCFSSALSRISGGDDNATSLMTLLKLIVFGSRNLHGKNLYCKFYHATRKHKTTVRKERKDPSWNEWFSLNHAVGEHNPRLVLEVWGSGLAGHSLKGSLALDTTGVLEGDIIDDYFELDGCKGEIRVKLTLLGPSIYDLSVVFPPLTGEQEEEVGSLHASFPGSAHQKIMNSYRCHQYDITATLTYLKTLTPEQLNKLGGTLCRKKGLHLSPEERDDCVQAILDLTPDVPRDEAISCLSENEYNVTQTVDDLIRRGRTVRTAESVIASPSYQLRKLQSVANTGGFISQLDMRTGEERILHQSVLRQGSSGLGKKEFVERKMLFEVPTKGGKPKRNRMKMPAQLPSGELAV